MFLATPPATAAADQRGMAARADRFDVLGTLTVPFLAAVGEDDPLTPPSAAEISRRYALRLPRGAAEAG